jgi:hypothetical protein
VADAHPAGPQPGRVRPKTPKIEQSRRSGRQQAILRALDLADPPGSSTSPSPTAAEPPLTARPRGNTTPTGLLSIPAGQAPDVRGLEEDAPCRPRLGPTREPVGAGNMPERARDP